jgi:hypothetical protein
MNIRGPRLEIRETWPSIFEQKLHIIRAGTPLNEYPPKTPVAGRRWGYGVCGDSAYEPEDELVKAYLRRWTICMDCLVLEQLRALIVLSMMIARALGPTPRSNTEKPPLRVVRRPSPSAHDVPKPRLGRPDSSPSVAVRAGLHLKR